MKIDTISRKFLVPVVGILALLSAACAATPAAPPAEQTKTSAAEEIEPWDGDGMEIPLDGTSLEAFERSLTRVKAHTSPDSYLTLVNAIDYLMIYDLGAKRDRARLASNLNGLTGNQVVAKVNWAAPETNQKPAQKSGAESSAIDT